MSTSNVTQRSDPDTPVVASEETTRAPSLLGGTAGRSRRLIPRWETAVAAGVVLLAFQFASLILPPFLAPDVPQIFSAVGEALRNDFGAVVLTVRRFAIALLTSIALGWFVGLCMATWRVVGRLLEPFFAIIMATPALSWILIAVLWIRGIESRVFFIVLIIAMPFYVVNTYEGVRGIDPELVEGVDQFRPTRWQQVKMLFIPYSVSFVIMTTKSVAGFTMRILVFAELIGASSGIGSEMNMAQANFRVDLVLAWTIVLIVVSFGVLAILRVVERSALRWRPQT